MAAAAVGLRSPGEGRTLIAGFGALTNEAEACLEMDRLLRTDELFTAVGDLTSGRALRRQRSGRPMRAALAASI